MLYKIMVMLHVLGAAVWIGGHVVLVGVVLPRAGKAGDPERVREFEGGFGWLGLASLAVQLVTGLWLAGRWIPSWSTIFSEPTSAGHLVLTKIALLVVTVGLAGYAYHRVLPRLQTKGLKRFSILAWVTTVVAVLMLVLGVGVRTGGFA